METLAIILFAMLAVSGLLYIGIVIGENSKAKEFKVKEFRCDVTNEELYNSLKNLRVDIERHNGVKTTNSLKIKLANGTYFYTQYNGTLEEFIFRLTWNKGEFLTLYNLDGEKRNIRKSYIVEVN